MAAQRQRDDMESIREARREVVEHVSGVSHPRKEHERRTATTPVQDMETLPVRVHER